ncbi:MAG: HPF/RaiA family ribosome-associated protein [bacterium]|nr:HPF/RaiA family ribosome-associated protein [bacterium]
MNKQISIMHQDVPKETRGYVESRLDAMQLFGNRLDSLTARLDLTHEVHMVELVAGVGGAGTLVAKASTSTLMGALDEAIDRLTCQLRKIHDKRSDRR